MLEEYVIPIYAVGDYPYVLDYYYILEERYEEVYK